MRLILTFVVGLLVGALLFSLSFVSAGPCDKDVLDIYRGAPRMPDTVVPLYQPGSLPYQDRPSHRSPPVGHELDPY